MSKQQKKQVTHGPPTVANFMQGVLQLSNVHGQAMNACRTIKELGATLLGVDHATKIRYISKIGVYCADVIHAIKQNQGRHIQPDALLSVLLRAEPQFIEAARSLAGPHVSIIAAVKLAANTITSRKGMKKDAVNQVLNEALKTVNAVNLVWYLVVHYDVFLWDLIRFLEPISEARQGLEQFRHRCQGLVKELESFSDGARMKVAEETLSSKLLVPNSKQFKTISKEAITMRGSVLRSEVVFKYKGKALSRVSKQQPMRLSIFGDTAVLTVSTLSHETLVIAPCHVSACEAAIDPAMPDSVLKITMMDKSLYLRCKIPSQRDAWITFFRSKGQAVESLHQRHGEFRRELSSPAHPMRKKS
eukprot:m.149212 g.149212  ORF g.149212 m.149212 type:complete len:360 (+) comp14202_c1_seq8:745-1824(+)